MIHPLPRLLVLTDRHLSPRPLVDTVRLAARDGVAVVFREKDLPAAERASLAVQIAKVVRDAGATLIVASDADLAARVGAVGVHQAAADSHPAGGGLCYGRSCHDEDEVRAAVAEGASYATVSPVHLTASKPGYGPALGDDGLRQLVAVAGDLPLYALGGIEAINAGAALEAGAYGVAVMGAVMAAADPAAVTADLLAAVSERSRR